MSLRPGRAYDPSARGDLDPGRAESGAISDRLDHHRRGSGKDAEPRGVDDEVIRQMESQKSRFLGALVLDVAGLVTDLERVAAQARTRFDVPLAIICLLDRGQIRLSARSGALLGCDDGASWPCACPTCSQTAVTVEDTASDGRTRFCSWMRTVPQVRFHARAPLHIGSGSEIGGLCLYDMKPRSFPPEAVDALEQVALLGSSLLRSHSLAYDAKLNSEALAVRVRLAEIDALDMKLKERRARQIARLSKTGTWSLELDTARLTYSEEFYRIFELPFGVPLDIATMRSFLHPSDAVRHQLLFRGLAERGERYDEIFEIFGARGTHKWVRSIVEADFLHGSPHTLFGSIQDVSERHRENRRLLELAHHDALTGLLNRHRFGELLNGIQATTDQPHGLLMVDIDHLKQINDTYGHDAGDVLISTVAHRLKAAIGSRGAVCRYGGDEFAVLLDGPTTAVDLEAVAKDIQDAMAAPFQYRGSSIRPSVTIGGSVDANLPSVEKLKRQADQELYKAKQAMRGSVSITIV